MEVVIEFVGDESFTVTFRPGTDYAYACEPHWHVMNGRFRTQAAPTTTTTAPPSVPTLQASVSSAGVVSLSPRTVRAGAVRMVVPGRQGELLLRRQAALGDAHRTLTAPGP